ncbi:MAG: hypothetical protein Q4G63_00885 [Bacteroidia bacterium]|nr:hypothetical protein [Bacteroidia bacterium]
MSRNIIITIFFGIIIFFAAGCSREADDTLAGGNLLPVKVAMVIDDNSQGTRSSTRAAGTIEEQNYNESEQTGNPADENHIGTLRLLVFDTGGTLRFNKMYSAAALITEDKIQLNNGVLTVLLQLYPGAYNFIAVTNEDTGWGLSSLAANSSTIANYNTLASQTITNSVTNAGTLSGAVAASKGIPMTGEQQFSIANIDATQTNPITLKTIMLKRTLAKVEVNLTNLQADNSIYPNAVNFQLVSVALHNINQQYTLLESATANITQPLSTVENSITHTQGALFPMQRILTSYMAERKGVSLATNTYIEIKTKKLGDDVVYTIPLYKGETTRDYSILRNHLYRVNCYLNGSGIIEVVYQVADWTLNYHQTIMGYGYVIDIAGDNISVSNTMQACDPHNVTLEPIGTTTINGSTASVQFTQLSNGASANYTIANKPGGEYLRIYYNGMLVKTL